MATSKSSKSKSPSKSKSSGKRELIKTKSDKRFVKRDTKGQFSESDDVSKSLRQDVKKTAKKKVRPGYSDQVDQPKKK